MLNPMAPEAITEL